MRVLWRNLTAFFLCFYLLGCGSVPISTLIRLSTFDEQDFAALDADVVRIRIALKDGFNLDVAASIIHVEIKSGSRSYVSAFELREESTEAVMVGGGLFSDPVGGVAYTLRLADSTKVKFRELQSFVSAGDADEINFSVNPAISSKTYDLTEVSAWIKILLSADQGYMAVFDPITVDLTKTTKTAG